MCVLGMAALRKMLRARGSGGVDDSASMVVFVIPARACGVGASVVEHVQQGAMLASTCVKGVCRAIGRCTVYDEEAGGGEKRKLFATLEIAMAGGVLRACSWGRRSTYNLRPHGT